MLEFKKCLNRRLNPRETIGVILIAAALAGAGYFSFKFAEAKILESRVSAAIPGVCGEIRKQRQTIVNAIEAYKTSFGFYPPDNVLSLHPLKVDTVNNPLLYELAGVVHNPTDQTFELAGLEAAEVRFVKQFFHCAGFTNCAGSAEQVKHFLSIDNLPIRQLHDDPDVFALGFQVSSMELPAEVPEAFDISAWRYTCSSPTNNPGKFDLWIEVKTPQKMFSIGNWKRVE